MEPPAFRLLQFRRVGTRLLLLLVGLVALAQCADYVLVVRANLRNAVDRIYESLDQGAQLFFRRVEARLGDLSARADVMTGDYALRQLFLADKMDPATVQSALRTYSGRLSVPFMVLMTPEGTRIADTGGALPEAALAPFQGLVKAGAAADVPEARGFARLPAAGPEGKLYALLVVPIYAPKPEIVAWIGLALPIDHRFAKELKEDARLDVTFFFGPEGRMEPVESTLSPEVARASVPDGPHVGHRIVVAGGDSYVTAVRPMPLLTPGSASIALQRSLDQELASSRKLERVLLVLLMLSLAAAALIAPAFARTLSQPLRALARHTQVIAAGDYATRLRLERADEIGQLATAFDRMSEGLQERDRVRDLLDKNVSPEVAAQLMRDGAVLGGEERDVTILFIDLRGFTRMSESIPAREVLALLNRHFDRMSGIVEAHSGVVDKYIGDAIMAVFGAPIPQVNHADNAILAALEMKAALAGLNRELAAEGRPPLSIGIGINTSRVIAGNMGSARRLNYSVVGDGVNIAARIQDLTRNPDYRADILVSAKTHGAALGRYLFRALGAAPLKGRGEPVEIFAVDGKA